jgi:predicted nucleotidyltransferase
MIDSRITERFKKDVGFDLEPHLLVLATMGSHSHGTYIPPSEPNAIDDVDLMGFVVPPLDYHLGLPRWEHWRMQYEELDVVLYSLDKAVRLLLKSNPNIMGILWLRGEDYIFTNELFDYEMRDYRDVFSALTAATAFSGYAYGQLKRMEAFNVERMTEYEGFTKTIRSWHPNGVELVLEADSNKIKHLALEWHTSQDFLLNFRKLHQQHFSGYMGEKRKAMVRQFEYDVKNAAHLIRLLRMGKEFLATGVLNVYRTTDADELRDIKQGKWTLQQVKIEAERLFSEVRVAEMMSLLPAEPDESAANDMLKNIQLKMLNLEGSRHAISSSSRI